VLGPVDIHSQSCPEKRRRTVLREPNQEKRSNRFDGCDGRADGTASVGTGNRSGTDGGQPPLSGGGAGAVPHGIAVLSRPEPMRAGSSRVLW